MLGSINQTKYFITNKKISYDTQLKYLITIPCVNREERSAINVIDKTLEEFEKSGLFESDISIDIMFFESGSNNINYLSFIEEYRKKYIKNITINYNNTPLNAVSNTLKMFTYISKLPEDKYDFILWMDDDVFVCKNFIKNADIWIKNYANFSIFSSLYIPYQSYPIKLDINKNINQNINENINQNKDNNQQNIHISRINHFYGTCCTVFKPKLSKHVIKNWYNQRFELFEFNPDARFRECVRFIFPQIEYIYVSYPSIVEHMNIGSSIYRNRKINKGHKSKKYIGSDKDPEWNII